MLPNNSGLRNQKQQKIFKIKDKMVKIPNNLSSRKKYHQQISMWEHRRHDSYIQVFKIKQRKANNKLQRNIYEQYEINKRNILQI